MAARISGQSPVDEDDEPAAETRQLFFAAHITACPVPNCSSLMNGLNACGFNFGTHLIRLIAHDHEHSLRRRNLKRGVDGVAHERLAPGPVQHFGHPGFHAGSLPRVPVLQPQVSFITAWGIIDYQCSQWWVDGW